MQIFTVGMSPKVIFPHHIEEKNRSRGLIKVNWHKNQNTVVGGWLKVKNGKRKLMFSLRVPTN
jgi:hypothetical protein